MIVLAKIIHKKSVRALKKFTFENIICNVVVPLNNLFNNFLLFSKKF